MQKFIRTNEVLAKPMTKREYNEYRDSKNLIGGGHWYDNIDDEGYLVEYLDSPNSNHENHKNYISWSPKDVFERSYKISETFKDRLLNEAFELHNKLEKLENFIKSSPAFVSLNIESQNLLKEQSLLMTEYYNVLNRRLENL